MSKNDKNHVLASKIIWFIIGCIALIRALYLMALGYSINVEIVVEIIGFTIFTVDLFKYLYTIYH